MNIVGKDFNIKKDHGSFILYIKNKNGNASLGGYFNNVYYALKHLYNWRKDKKYPHKENPKEMLIQMQRYKEIKARLNNMKDLLYVPITKLNEEVNGVRGIQSKSKY